MSHLRVGKPEMQRPVMWNGAALRIHRRL